MKPKIMKDVILKNMKARWCDQMIQKSRAGTADIEATELLQLEV
jgi:hypothetical protein